MLFCVFYCLFVIIIIIIIIIIIFCFFVYYYYYYYYYSCESGTVEKSERCDLYVHDVLVVHQYSIAFLLVHNMKAFVM